MSTKSDQAQYHIVATYDGSATAAGIKFYINGISQTTSNYGPPTLTGSDSILNNTAPTIGDVPAAGSMFYGVLDDVRVYNRVLSAGEVLRLYQTTGGQ